jgi:hypothetical protein
MPILKKETTETASKFISRCMDNEVMIKEYPDEDQRFAVCIDQLKIMRIVRKSDS